ncbi:Methyltransferase domain-containing protein [Streptomyces sp. yr375]|uniref:class I SAM-dependent methyltransferase n=1 Tax=Streptomyces sp. yr375 TaxID=1761906 RepID=UPI0008B155E4|nr:class I SAM-dependent methyltransferase [Streptomyces sp. yr375]SER47784.1 Methyltransferase domain-containing protein [Streptomyces sp. yr375]
MGDVTAGDQRELQGDYHRRIFHALHDWDRSWAGALDVAGGGERARSLGFDQLGHFGAQGCALVAAELARGLGTDRPPVLAEFGCGFGGALRDVVRGLGEHGVEVGRALGFDIVWDHVRLFRTIQGSPSGGTAPGAVATAQPVQADARAVPVRDGALDAVVCTGSLPHFADVAQVFAEAARTLRPGAPLVMTEEVSLLAPGRGVSPEFRRLHPPEIFFLAEIGERVEQLRKAGFTEIGIRDLTAWACGLLNDRIKVMRIFFGDVAVVYGEDEAQTLLDTLEVAREEYLGGAVVPALVTARTTP